MIFQIVLIENNSIKDNMFGKLKFCLEIVYLQMMLQVMNYVANFSLSFPGAFCNTQ